MYICIVNVSISIQQYSEREGVAASAQRLHRRSLNPRDYVSQRFPQTEQQGLNQSETRLEIYTLQLSQRHEFIFVF